MLAPFFAAPLLSAVVPNTQGGFLTKVAAYVVSPSPGHIGLKWRRHYVNQETIFAINT